MFCDRVLDLIPMKIHLRKVIAIILIFLRCSHQIIPWLLFYHYMIQLLRVALFHHRLLLFKIDLKFLVDCQMVMVFDLLGVPHQCKAVRGGNLW